MPLLIQTLTDGRSGPRAQAEGLAQAIVLAAGGEVEHALLSPSVASRLMPLPVAAAFTDAAEPCSSGKADIVIGSGKSAQAATLATARRDGAFAVCIDRPRRWGGQFDAIIAPLHDYPSAEAEAKDPRLLLTLGSVGGVAPNKLAAAKEEAERRFAALPRPLLGVLIGGSNRAYSLTPEYCRQLAADILSAAPDMGVIVTASRRTGEDCIRELRRGFAADRCFFYDGSGPDNPYMQLLALADTLLVTGESVNMLSEACSAKKPVYYLRLPPKSARAGAKFRRLQAALERRQLARPWQGKLEEWDAPGYAPGDAPGLNETARAAEFVLTRWRAWRQRGG